MKTYLVTGAAGFIGSAVARSLLKDGNAVVTIDNLSTGKTENIPHGCTFIQGNTFDVETINKLNNYQFSSIIHIAGQSSGEVSFENPVYDLQSNTQSTLMLLKFAKKIGCKDFIYASSMSVYGDHIKNPYVSEESLTEPKSLYAVGKLASEKYMRIFSAYGIRTTVLRFFNVYGVGQNMENLKQGMASIYLAQAIGNKHIIVKGSKDRFRDFVYIDDVVDSVKCAINRKSGNLFEIYNVCNGKKISVENILQIIKDNLSFPVTIEFIEGTLGDQNGIYGDYSKINNELNWKGKIPFEQGMIKMINWSKTM